MVNEISNRYNRESFYVSSAFDPLFRSSDYAVRHFQMAGLSDISQGASLAHRIIGAFELCPLIGCLVGLKAAAFELLLTNYKRWADELDGAVTALIALKNEYRAIPAIGLEVSSEEFKERHKLFDAKQSEIYRARVKIYDLWLALDARTKLDRNMLSKRKEILTHRIRPVTEPAIERAGKALGR